MYESSEHDANDRIKKDTSNIEDMYYLEMNHYKILQVRRLGKKNDDESKLRPLLVEFETEEEKWIILSQGKYLKSSDRFYSIFISKDMTKEEQEYDTELKKELEERRANHEGVMIKNGRVINKTKSEQTRY